MWYKIGKFKPTIGTGAFGPPVVVPRYYLVYENGGVDIVSYEYLPLTAEWTPVASSPAVVTSDGNTFTLSINGTDVLRIDGDGIQAVTFNSKAMPWAPIAKFVILSRNVPEILAIAGSDGRLYSNSFSTVRALDGTGFVFSSAGVPVAEINFAGVTASAMTEGAI